MTRHPLEHRRQLLEIRAKGGAAPCRRLEQEDRASRIAFESRDDAVDVAVDPARAIIHEVAGVRHEELRAERLAALQLTDERDRRANLKEGIRRCEVDEIAVVDRSRDDLGLRER